MNWQVCNTFRQQQAIKAYPTIIQTAAEARKLPQVGAKIGQQVRNLIAV